MAAFNASTFDWSARSFTLPMISPACTAWLDSTPMLPTSAPTRARICCNPSALRSMDTCPEALYASACAATFNTILRAAGRHAGRLWRISAALV
ncbi:hypothetical protein [Corallococcus exiguus]|uniref:hypothetical protein n=1 Tax=Corallococcus exiguus TaxID=83462 RepID=UPI0023ECD303|nr:hypothetical protein [Corallococcus exiguus]